MFKLLLEHEGIDVYAKCIEKEDHNYEEECKHEDYYKTCNYVKDGTALHLAINNNNIEVFKLLLAHKGINLNARYVYEKDKNYRLSKEYGDWTKDIEESWNYTALHLAVKNNNIEMVKILLDSKKLDINGKYEWKRNYREQDKDKDWKEKDNNENNGTALHIAVENNYIEMVKLLLEQKEIDVNAQDKNGQTPFFIACKKQYKEIIELLNNNVRQRIELMNASKNGEIDKVEMLIKQKGFDVNIKNNGETALMCAAENGHIEIVKILLQQNGIDINAKDNNGQSALIKASSNGKLEIVKILLEQEGIDIFGKNKDGKDAFAIAAEKRQYDIVRMLIDKIQSMPDH